MKKLSKNIRIYQDSKEIPFLNYKRIIQTGDFYYMVKGYEPGDDINYDVKKLQDKFQEIEEEYATSMNVKNTEILSHGEIAALTSEFNKYNILLLLLEQVIKGFELRNNLLDLINDLIDNNEEENPEEIRVLLELTDPGNAEFSYSDIKENLKQFKIQKSDDIYVQKKYIEARLDKLSNQIRKLSSQIKEKEIDKDNADFDIEEEFVNVCVGLDTPVNDKVITLYQYGKMVKALMVKVEEIKKMNSYAG